MKGSLVTELKEDPHFDRKECGYKCSSEWGIVRGLPRQLFLRMERHQDLVQRCLQVCAGTTSSTIREWNSKHSPAGTCATCSDFWILTSVTRTGTDAVCPGHEYPRLKGAASLCEGGGHRRAQIAFTDQNRSADYAARATISETAETSRAENCSFQSMKSSQLSKGQDSQQTGVHPIAGISQYPLLR